ncbi:hypothetical protein V8F06_006106 [Rhypophila decipiens]
MVSGADLFSRQSSTPRRKQPHRPLFAPWENIALNPLPPMVVTVKPKEKEPKGLRKLGKRSRTSPNVRSRGRWGPRTLEAELPEAVLDGIKNATFDVHCETEGEGAQGSPKAGKKDRADIPINTELPEAILDSTRNATFDVPVDAPRVDVHPRPAQNQPATLPGQHQYCPANKSLPPSGYNMSGYPSVSSGALATVFTVTVAGVNPEWGDISDGEDPDAVEPDTKASEPGCGEEVIDNLQKELVDQIIIEIPIGYAESESAKTVEPVKSEAELYTNSGINSGSPGHRNRNSPLTANLHYASREISVTAQKIKEQCFGTSLIALSTHHK